MLIFSQCSYVMAYWNYFHRKKYYFAQKYSLYLTQNSHVINASCLKNHILQFGDGSQKYTIFLIFFLNMQSTEKGSHLVTSLTLNIEIKCCQTCFILCHKMRLTNCMYYREFVFHFAINQVTVNLKLTKILFITRCDES